MTFRHAVMYTPRHTWTTLKDKNLSIEETDKVCDLHFAYMGYGKFTQITPINSSVSTTSVLPTMKTLTIDTDTSREEPVKTPITRNRHGAHPSRTTSAHINYYNLNHGQDLSDKKSSPAHSHKPNNKKSLREPTASRIAAQTHITQSKTKKLSVPENTDEELSVVAMLSPDEDGTPFSRPAVTHGKVIGTAVKIESTQINKIYEEDEQPAYAKEEKIEHEIKSEKDEHPAVIQPDPEQLKPQPNKDRDDPIIEKVLYTHAHGHTCTKKNCNPIILSNKGIIRPERPSTTHYHLGGTCSDGGEKLQPPGLEIPSLKTEETLEHEEDEQQDPPVPTKSSEHTDPLNIAVEPNTVIEKDEHTLEAAGGLLMLQNIDTIGNLANKVKDIPDDNNVLPPLTMKNENVTPTSVDQPDLGSEAQPILPETDKDISSDDTIAYEPPEADTPPNGKTQISEETPPVKGTLTIREIGILKPGTSTTQPSTDVMPVITTSGKVQCDFCKRAFNTLSEQKQHMVRRHHAQLKEKEEKEQREKDELKVQETEREIEEEAPELEHNAKRGTNNTRKRKKEIEKDEQPTKRKKQKVEKSDNHPKPTTRSHTRSEDTTKPTRKRKRTHETDEHEKSKKNEISQLKVHTKRRRINRKSSTDHDRAYNCHICEKTYDTQSELNHHHKQKHPPVQCSVCKQMCATPNTLSRHMYKHKDRNYSCQYCNEKFAFKSEVDLHMANHLEETEHYCRQCTKSFKRIGELREHEQVHSNKTLYCPRKGCNFSGKLRRYIRTHLKTTHAEDGDLPYPCKYKNCDRAFKFYEQRKRHYSNDH